MPILVRDFTWTQTLNTINVRIPLDPVYREKVDLFTTDKYIKAHFSPFLFEVFLQHDIDSVKSKCILQDNLIVFDLLKKEELDWDALEKILSRNEKAKLREEILLECQVKAKAASEEKAIKKSQLDRFTVQQAMDIDNKQHNLMDSRRDAERNKAMDDLENWRLTKITDNVKQNKIINNECNTHSGVSIIELPDEDEVPKVEKKPAKNPSRPIVKMPVQTPVMSEYIERKKEEAVKRVLPKLRESGLLEIKHTPRTFPTPSRESTAQEEEAWLKNITQARKAIGFVSEDLRPEEQDPQWCKEKGDEFFRNGNYLGAISAYTHGITLSDKLPTLYANRAATHFALGNFNKCVTDCSSALDLMKPACEGNRRSRAKCIARRAAGLARLGYLNKAIDEMKAASKLLPDDENIKKDIYDMERAWEQNPDSD
ncbi:dynein assembly factor 4, axonemal-like [Zerene cesonia]|uniref:dynein assembly factor 4, axonemal-like n=1 Tax=Zerene cesonia TaxID=33412 RepID=UPI0018E5A784|nr:dynein assembly factor 4, axonemal-like [Zerene cesonia]